MNIELSDRQIGKNVAQMRETAGLSMEATADAMRERRYAWTRNTIFAIEHGSRRLRFDEAVALVQLFGFSVDDGLQRLSMQSESGRATTEIRRMAQSAVTDLLSAYARIRYARMRAKWALGYPPEHDWASDLHMGHDWTLDEAEREQIETEIARLDGENLRALIQEIDDLDGDELESIEGYDDLYEISVIASSLPVSLREHGEKD